MVGLRQVRDCLLTSHSLNIINTEEFILLYDLNSSKNPDFSFWCYENFDLDKFNDDECKASFRFLKNDVYFLKEVLDIPDQIICPNRSVVSGIEALCILLRRYAYPIRLGDMVPIFGRSVPQLSMIATKLSDMIYNTYSHKLTNLQQPWLAPACLQSYADAVHQAGAPLTNCWGFIDGTVRSICRPGESQRIVYNGHHRVHALKYQSIACPNGLIANLYGPVEGRRHDSGMLADSGIYQQIQQICHAPNGSPLCIYGDLAYPLRPQLQAPFRNARLNQQQAAYNTAMSKVRIGVEWVFGDIINYFKFLDYKKNLKLGLTAVGKIYVVCAFINNLHTCMYGSISSDYFQIEPPTVQEYVQ